MRLLANENFPGPAVHALRAAGHDVLWARTEMAGQDDPAILLRAQQEQRILLTFDKDFGDLAFRSGLPSDCGVILFRSVFRRPMLQRSEPSRSWRCEVIGPANSPSLKTDASASDPCQRRAIRNFPAVSKWPS